MMDFPPPEMSMPPPNFQPPPHHQPMGYQPRPFHNNFHHKPFYKPHYKHGMQVQDDFDGKRLRKSVMRKTIDYNASIVRAIENRVWQRDFRDRRALQPENMYIPDMMPPSSYLDNPSNAITTRFVKTATNKMRCPVFTLAWTPEGRRLITGASSGEFTLWNGLTFNFETILQAHTVSVRAMVWSHNDNWMVTGDHNGFVKYWQSNMNNVKQFQAHKEPIRGISFCPTDAKFASCSDDGTVRIYDFLRCQEERVLRGHGADVKCVHWHPQKSLVVSGSKDNQQPIKLWDPKCGQALATLHAHKSTVMDLKWNDNGNWLVTASRDHLLKLFDLRNLKEDMQTFRGHKKEASAVTWHPIHEGLFTSGGSDGQILFWNVGTDKEIGGIEAAHESIVWTLAWHPIGHILCSGSNDHTVKFWTRNRPGDQMRDKYNLNTLPASLAGLEDYEMDEHIVIPGMGMGPEDRMEFGDMPMPMNDLTTTISNQAVNNPEPISADHGIIPGLDLDTSSLRDREKKTPYSKPIPKNFQAQWNEPEKGDEMYGLTAHDTGSILTCVREVISQMIEQIPGTISLSELKPEKLVVYGKEIEITPGSRLHKVIMQGSDALYEYIQSGDIDELIDAMPFEDNSDYTIEDFIQENAKATIGDEQDMIDGDFTESRDDQPYEIDDDDEDDEEQPNVKRFRSEYDSYDRGDRDWDAKEQNSNNNGPGIPSLLNLNVGRRTADTDVPQKSPTITSPWENAPFSNNGSFNNQQNNNNRSTVSNNRRDDRDRDRDYGSARDRRDGRENRRGSRWSSKR